MKLTLSASLLLLITIGVSSAQDTLHYFDFNGDLDGWTTIDNSAASSGDVWVWSVEGPTGEFAIDTIESTTAANGFALFDSDLYCSFSQNSPLVSPSFDFSSEAEIEVRYQNFYRRYQDEVFIGVSTDGGATYSEISLYPDVALNDFRGDNPNIERIDISALAAGQDSVVIAFRFQGGCDYAWMIDDVAIANMVTPRPNTQLVVQDNFFAGAPNYETPQTYTEAESLYFLADVLNDGALAQTNVQLRIQIYNESDQLIYLDSLDYGTIASDSLAENKPFPDGFPMPTETGTYTGIYTILSDSSMTDAMPADDSVSFEFVVTEDRFSKAPVSNGGVQPGIGADNFEVGNIYYTRNMELTGPVAIDSVELRFFLEGLSDNTTETVIEINTYGYRGDLNEDGIPQRGDIDDNDAELVALGFNEYEFTSTNSPEGSYADVIAPSIDDGQVIIPTGEGFIGFAIGVSYVESSGPGTTTDQFFIGTGDDVEYSAYNFVTDTLDLEETYTSFLFLGGSNESSFNFAQDGIWINAMVGTIVNVREQLAESSVHVRPNPASNRLFVDVDIDPSLSSMMTIRNAVGQEVLRRSDVGMGKQTLDVSLSGLNPGLYYLEVLTEDDKVAIRRFMISR